MTWIQRMVGENCVADTLEKIDQEYNIIEWSALAVGDYSVLIVANVTPRYASQFVYDVMPKREEAENG